MNEHEDRSPLIMKIALRQALARLQGENSSLAQLEALAGNLGWEEMAPELARARKELEGVINRLQEAVEAAVRLQAVSAHAHAHAHQHAHTHTHPHTHPHDHDHPEGTEGEHTHQHTHRHQHLHQHPHDHRH